MPRVDSGRSDGSPVASRTARLAAAYRARATERVPPICEDPWAKYLVGEGHTDLLDLGDATVPEMGLGVALRTAWLDARVRRTTARQVVVLGAGLDTRAARLSRDGVRFFEVDQPATQEYKRAVLARAPGYPLVAATFVGCDLERDDFRPLLVEAGFRADEPSVVVWEGVLPYLTSDAVRTTIRRLRAAMAPGSHLFFDYVTPAHVDGAAATASKLGEPFVFTTADIRPMLREEGLPRADVVSMRAICRQLHAEEPSPAPFFDRWILTHVSQ